MSVYPIPAGTLLSASSSPSTSSPSSWASTSSAAASGSTATTRTSSVSEEPPRKRLKISTQLEMQRSESSISQYSLEESSSGKLMYPTLDQEAERDRDYYFPDADCVVRVGGTLFKVHKFLLARDASAFHDMFAMPSLDEDAGNAGLLREGGNDANPIVLYGETEDEFRILLSALYALPSELQQYSTCRSDVSRLITISYLTNKYHFTSTSQWAISSLYTVLARCSAPPITNSSSPLNSPTSPTRASSFGWDVERLPEEYDLNTCAPELLVRILDVAMVCGHAELSALVESRWTDRLWSSPLSEPGRKTAWTRADEAKWAVSVADRWAMGQLRGVAYYVCLMETGKDLTRVAHGSGSDGGVYGAEGHHHDMPLEDLTTAIPSHAPPPPLTSTQTTHLLLGHLSLAHLWDDDLRVSAPTIPTPSPGSCTYHQHGCIYTWVSAWREAARSPATLKLRTSDVVGRVRSMEKQLVGNDGLIVALTPGCRRKALCAVREMVKGLEEGLGDHFGPAMSGES